MRCILSGHPKKYNIATILSLTLLEETLILRFTVCLAQSV
jgi:hypothetical protein